MDDLEKTVLNPAPGSDIPDTDSILTDLAYDGSDSFVSDMEEAISSVSQALKKKKKIALSSPPKTDSERGQSPRKQAMSMIKIDFDMGKSKCILT